METIADMREAIKLREQKEATCLRKITKQSSLEDDCLSLRLIWRDAQRAYCDSINALQGCGVGQPSRHYHAMLAASSKATDKCRSMCQRFGTKYGVDANLEVEEMIIKATGATA